MARGEDADEDSKASSDQGEDVTDVAVVGLAPALSNGPTIPRQRLSEDGRGPTSTSTAAAREKIQAGTRKAGGKVQGSSPKAQKQGRKDIDNASYRSDDDAAHHTDVSDEDDTRGDFDEGSDEGSDELGGSEAEEDQGSVDGGVGYAGENERRFACQVCKKRFWRKTHLTRHSKAHQGKYEYHCEHCGKAFYRRDQYSVHLRSHTGERPYACAFQGCGKKFTQKGALTRHERVHNRYRLWLSKAFARTFFGRCCCN